MASVSSLPQVKRRKPAVYGKASRNINSWNINGFDVDDDEQVKSKPTFKVNGQRSTAVKETYPVRKHDAKPHTLKAIKRRKEKQDAWDVPSTSDEEEEEEFTVPVQRSASPSKVAAKRKSVSLVQDVEPELAPWERKQKQSTQSNSDSRRIRTYGSAAQKQLASELSSSLQPPTTGPVSGTKAGNLKKKKKTEESSPEKSTEKLASPKNSAVARLQARRKTTEAKPLQSTPNPSLRPAQVQIPKRLGQDTDDLDTPARKKLRPASPEKDDVDVTMEDASPACPNTPKTNIPKSDELDVFDFPDDAPGKSNSLRQSNVKRKDNSQAGRRGKLSTFASQRKMDSAPSRLTEMLANMDSDTTEDSSRSVSRSASRPNTPHKPSDARSSTPDASARVSMTPKQTQLWDRLLPSTTVAPSPSALGLEELTLKSRKPLKTTTAIPRSLPKSSSDLGPRRTKLVDRLKASNPSHDTDSGDSDEDEASDVQMGDGDQTKGEEDNDSDRRASLSQSQSQSQVLVSTGPKRTYAQSRSHLAEDSFEDSLLFGLPGESPEKSATTSRRTNTQTTSNSQQSAFDMDDSDDEGAGGRMRTIHELRAGGGNQRFMDSIGGLLEDVADHNASARSRRRSALIELANKLAEKSFAEKFIRQGYEQHLLAETSAVADEIADFALAAAFTVLLAGEPSEHIVYTLREGDLLLWAHGMLENRTDIKKLAKERRNNMSKSAQNTLSSFAGKFASQESVWKDMKHAALTPRVVALKVCELLISRLRRLGDRSELVAVKNIRNIVPAAADLEPSDRHTCPPDVVLAISTLEALSTTAISLSWPIDALESLRSVLVAPALGDGEAQHLLFLTLRLSLNLTNGNPRNCKVFSQLGSVLCLLRLVVEGFKKLHADMTEEQRTVNLDLLVLSMGILINLTENNDKAREHSATKEGEPLLGSLVEVFQQGQQRLLEAESVEQGVTNVAYGYLAVLLASLCRNQQAKDIVASKLPGKNLHALIDAVEEFVKHHQRVDTLSFDGEEGMEVWSAFTEKLKGVLERLKAVSSS